MSWDKLAGKIRPGTYNNFESGKVTLLKGGTRGVCLVPILKPTYGPEKEWIKISSAAPDGNMAKLGHSVYDDDDQMLYIEEAIKGGAQIVYAWICSEGKKASAVVSANTTTTGSGDSATETTTQVTATAKYGGSRGNKLTVTVDAVPVLEGETQTYDIIISLDGDIVAQHEKVATLAELIALDDEWIDFSGDGELAATEAAGVTLSGGDDTEVTNADLAAYIDAWEKLKFNAACVPLDGTENPTIMTAAKSKIKYIRETIEHCGCAVLTGFKADYEGIINVGNGYAIGDKVYTPAQATAYVAGAYSGAGWQNSMTHRQVDGATACVPDLDNEEIEAAITAGQYVFSMSEEGNVVNEYDINSLTTMTTKRDKAYKKNRIIRTLDAFNETIHLNFPPNKYDNDEDGWDLMEGVGKKLLKLYDDSGAISEVDYDEDFLVDREQSEGDETYFNVKIKPTDSAEKLFFTTKTV